jgi:hypothetical protein
VLKAHALLVISAVSATENGAKQQINIQALRIELFYNLKLSLQKLQLCGLSADLCLG